MLFWIFSACNMQNVLQNLDRSYILISNLLFQVERYVDLPVRFCTGVINYVSTVLVWKNKNVDDNVNSNAYVQRDILAFELLNLEELFDNWNMFSVLKQQLIIVNYLSWPEFEFSNSLIACKHISNFEVETVRSINTHTDTSYCSEIR